MRQVLQAPRRGTTVVRDVPRPHCTPGTVLVDTAFSAISSGTERARTELSKQSLIGKARARPDLVREVWTHARAQGVGATARAVQHRLGEELSVGYSCAGTVVEVGEHVRGLYPGDRVACAGGTANHAEFVAVPANLCARIPDQVPLEVASLTTIAAVAMHAIRLSGARVGSRVAVIGCGLVGQIALRLLRAAGAETFALDIDPARVEQARSGGSDHASTIDSSVAGRVSALSGSAGMDAVIVAATAADSEPLLLAGAIARDRGSVILVGAVPVTFPREPLYEKELRFRISRSYGPGRYDPEYEERGLDYPIGYVRWTEQRNMEAILRLQAQRLVSFADLVEIVPVERAAEAYRRLTAGRGEQPRGAFVLAHGAAPVNGVAVHDEPTSAVVRASLPPASKSNLRRADVRVGLIGPGSFAKRVLVPALKAEGARLVTVAGGSGPSTAAAARSVPFDRVASDETALITDPEVDAVVIATRHGSHATLVAQALAAGKHVFCEKPLALTGDELDLVIETAQASSGTLLVGFNRRFSPLLVEMRAFLEEPGSPMTIAYRVSAGRLRAGHWINDLAQGGGRVLGEVCHFVDSVSFLAGGQVVGVHAIGHGPPATPVQAWDNVVVNLRLADSGVASIVYVGDGSPRLPKERVEGFCGARTAVLADYSTLELFDARKQRRRRARTQDKGHRPEIAAFLEAVRTGEPAVGLDQLGNASRATLAIVESLRTTRPCEVSSSPPAHGSIGGPPVYERSGDAR